MLLSPQAIQRPQRIAARSGQLLAGATELARLGPPGLSQIRARRGLLLRHGQLRFEEDQAGPGFIEALLGPLQPNSSLAQRALDRRSVRAELSRALSERCELLLRGPACRLRFVPTPIAHRQPTLGGS